MKPRLTLVAFATVALGALVAWAASGGDATGQQADEDNRITSTFHVVGMTCGGCEVAVRRVVGRLEGVDEVEASYEEGTATVTYRAARVTPESIIAAIEELGYKATLAGDEEGHS